MATLEDAADDLVVKLRGLDTEIEESEHKLEGLRGLVEAAAGEVDKEWTALAHAATSFLEKAAEEQQHLDAHARQTLQALSTAHEAVARDGAESRSEIGQGRGQVHGLGKQVAGLEPSLDSLVTEAGEAPAHGLAQRAHELEQELGRLVDEARDFLSHDVVPAVEKAAAEVHDHAQQLHQALADEYTAELQKAYDAWEAEVDALEEHLATEVFQASHQHARDCVECTVEECEAASAQALDGLKQLVGVLLTQLQELATGVEQSAETLVAQAGAELAAELDQARTSGAAAVAALDRVRQTLASYTFVEV